ncbi:MAG TPA: hypothetical protein VK171_07395 [Fimbriimonas sp.]|nr:hypothetical protein [Fimbriimonas sp.]
MNRPLATALAACLGVCAFADVEYTVRAVPAAKTFAVSMTVTNPGETEKFNIPAWCPGFYFLLDYNRRISDVAALDENGGKLRIQWAGGHSFTVFNPEKLKFNVNYRVLGNDPGLGFFRAHLRSTSGFINGPSTFMYASNHMLEPHRVKFSLPPDWDIATAMNSPKAGVYESEGYDEFVDHPIQLGKFVRRKFEVMDIPFEAIFVADGALRCDPDEETERLKQASVPAIKMMGSAPFKRYMYIVHLEVGDFSGGLEHRASNVIAVANFKSLRLDSLATHEFFHAWNVKQIRPDMLGPFDYSKEQRNPNIWFSEGVTDYYANIHAYQAGFLTRSQLLDQLTNEIEELQSSNVRKRLTLEDVCKQTWENGGFGVEDLSYYTKGLVIGLVADAAIRTNSKGEKSLDDLMRNFYERYALPKPGFGYDAIKEEMIALGGAEMGEHYDTMVRSTNEMPYQLLTGMGLRLAIPGQMYSEPYYLLDSKQRVINSASTNLVAPLQDGDVIVSAKYNGDETAMITYVRNGKTETANVPVRTYRAGDYRLQIDPYAKPEARARLEEWLKIPA